MDDLQIRNLEPDDMDALMQIETRIFSAPWAREDYLKDIDAPYAYPLVLTLGERIIGYGSLWVLFEEAQVTTFGIDIPYQHHGYGKILLEAMIRLAKAAQAQTMSLEVRVSNQVALALYRSFGFEVVSTRSRYYPDNHEDAYLMIKEIDV